MMMLMMTSAGSNLVFTSNTINDPSAGPGQGPEPFGNTMAARSFVRNINQPSFPSFFRGQASDGGGQHQQRRGRGSLRASSKQPHRADTSPSEGSRNGVGITVDATFERRPVQGEPPSSSSSHHNANEVTRWKLKTWQQRFARKNQDRIQKRKNDISRARSATRLSKLQILKEAAKSLLTSRASNVTIRNTTETGPEKEDYIKIVAATKLQTCFRKYRELKQQQHQQRMRHTNVDTDGAAPCLPLPSCRPLPPSHPQQEPSKAPSPATKPRNVPPPSHMERQYSEITMSDFGDSRHSLRSHATSGSNYSFAHSAASSSLPPQGRGLATSKVPKQRSRRWKAVVHHSIKHQEKQQQSMMMPPPVPRPSVGNSNMKLRSSFDSLDEFYSSLGEEVAEDDTIVSIAEEGNSEHPVQDFADAEKTVAEDDDRPNDGASASMHDEPPISQDMSPTIMASNRRRLLRRQFAESSSFLETPSLLETASPRRPTMIPDPRSSPIHSSPTHCSDCEGDDNRSSGAFLGAKKGIVSCDSTRQYTLESGSSGTGSTRCLDREHSNSERAYRMTDDIRLTTTSGHSSFSSYFDASTIASTTEDFGSGTKHNNGIKIDSPVKRPQRRLSPASSNYSFGSGSDTSQQHINRRCLQIPGIPDIHNHDNDSEPLRNDMSQKGGKHHGIIKPPLSPSPRRLTPVVLMSSSSRWDHDSPVKPVSPRRPQSISTLSSRIRPSHDMKPTLAWKTSNELSRKKDGHENDMIKSHCVGTASLLCQDSPARMPPRKLSPYPLIFDSVSVETNFNFRLVDSPVQDIGAGDVEPCPAHSMLRVPQRKASNPCPSYVDFDDELDTDSTILTSDASENLMVSPTRTHQNVVPVKSNGSCSILPPERATKKQEMPRRQMSAESLDVSNADVTDNLERDQSQNIKEETGVIRTEVHTKLCGRVDGVVTSVRPEKEESPRSVMSLDAIGRGNRATQRRQRLQIVVNRSIAEGSGPV